MRFPVNEIYVSQKFSNTHRGIDLGWFNNPNQVIYSACDGKVIDIQKQTSGGNVIHILYTNGITSLGYVCEYAHLKDNSIKVKIGEYVKKGQEIALMGKTGKNCKGNHLHFGIYKGNYINYRVDKWIDPLKYICVYKDQKVASGTSKLYKLYYTKIASGIPKTEIGDAMYVRVKNGKIVGKVYNGDEVEYYGVKRYLPKLTKLAIVNNLLEYTTVDKYLC